MAIRTNGIPGNDPASDAEPRLGRSVTIDHAAELLGVSRRTVYYRIREGRLRTVRTIAGGSQRVLIDSIQVLVLGGSHPPAARGNTNGSGNGNGAASW